MKKRDDKLAIVKGKFFELKDSCDSVAVKALSEEMVRTEGVREGATRRDVAREAADPQVGDEGVWVSVEFRFS